MLDDNQVKKIKDLLANLCECPECQRARHIISFAESMVTEKDVVEARGSIPNPGNIDGYVKKAIIGITLFSAAVEYAFADSQSEDVVIQIVKNCYHSRTSKLVRKVKKDPVMLKNILEFLAGDEDA